MNTNDVSGASNTSNKSSNKSSNKFKKGDKVLVSSVVEKEDGWENAWVPDISYAVGKIFTVESQDIYGVRLKEDNWYDFPPSCLIPVGEKLTAIYVFDKVPALFRFIKNNDETWVEAIEREYLLTRKPYEPAEISSYVTHLLEGWVSIYGTGT